jgi:hypothetical protein
VVRSSSAVKRNLAASSLAGLHVLFVDRHTRGAYLDATRVSRMDAKALAKELHACTPSIGED